MRTRYSLAVFLALALSFSSCGPSPAEKPAPAAKAVMSDSDLKSQIETKLNSDPDMKAENLSVSANADRNTVTLSGTVESERRRDQAVAMAKDAHPGIAVEDKIDVKPRELSRAEYTEEHARSERDKAKEWKDKLGSSVDDAWIHTKVVSKLIGDSQTPEHRINVDVNNNVVTLRGTVDSSNEKAEAARIARETEGVKRVIDQIKVVPSMKD